MKTKKRTAQKGISPIIFILIAVAAIGAIALATGKLKPNVPTPSTSSSPSTTGSQSMEWETYTNSQYGYSVKMPKGWTAKDSSDGTKRVLRLTHPNNYANALIAAHKDDTLGEPNGMTNAIQGRKEFLESDKGLTIADFQQKVESKAGGWMMFGEKMIEGNKWKLHERGFVDIYGKVILMQTGYSESYGKEYKDILPQILDSFRVE